MKYKFHPEAENELNLSIDYYCDSRYPFAYTLYTKKQNALMHHYQGLFRFTAETPEGLLAHACRTLDGLLHKEFAEDTIQTKGRHRNRHDIDPTLPEAGFEQAFIDRCGRLLFCYNRCRLLREKLCSLDPCVSMPVFENTDMCGI